MNRFTSLIASVSAVIIMLALCISSGAAEIPVLSKDVYVYDYAKILSKDTEKHISSTNEKLYNKTKGRIVIVTVDTTDDLQIRDFSNKIFDNWDISNQEKMNSLLLLISLDKDTYWITQGSGIESRLTSESLKTMLDSNLEPYFASGQYDKGVYSMFNKFVSSYESIYSIDLEDTVEAKADGIFSRGVITTLAIVTVIVLFITLMIFIAKRTNNVYYARTSNARRVNQLPSSRRSSSYSNNYNSRTTTSRSRTSNSRSTSGRSQNGNNRRPQPQNPRRGR